jgi:hypothetical protein
MVDERSTKEQGKRSMLRSLSDEELAGLSLLTDEEIKSAFEKGRRDRTEFVNSNIRSLPIHSRIRFR